VYWCIRECHFIVCEAYFWDAEEVTINSAQAGRLKIKVNFYGQIDGVPDPSSFRVELNVEHTVTNKRERDTDSKGI